MGGNLPSPLALLLAAAIGWTTACTKPPLDVLVDKSFIHLEAATAMIERHAGDERALLEASMGYRAQHAGEFKALRTEGERLLADQPEETQRQMATASKNRAAPLLARIAAAVQKYPDQKRALSMIRPLVVTATPRTKPGSWPGWVPKDLPPTPTIDMFGGGGAQGGGQHDHSVPAGAPGAGQSGARQQAQPSNATATTH
ncbi:MAG: hypothetical protein EXR77_05420 [Myxococcales bacterium]|nr:hypothetical protein [Myxococcales bacterium]